MLKAQPLLCLLALGAPAAPLLADTHVLPPVVVASIEDSQPDGAGDVLDTGTFRGLIRTTSSVEDRAIHEYDVTVLTDSVISATFSGQVHVNNAYDNGVRTFDFLVYAGNGSAEITDFEISAVLVGTGQYHPPNDTSFDYDIDATSAVQTLVVGGATHIGLRVQASSNPNFPNILSDTLGTLEIVTGTGGIGTAYCFGDGAGTPCPCANNGATGKGCANSWDFGGGRLGVFGSSSVTAGNLFFAASGVVASQPGLYFQGDNAVNGGLGNLFGDGLRCAGGALVRIEVAFADAGGVSFTTIDIAAKCGVSAGDTRRYQLWYRDPGTSPCGTEFNLTNGIELTWTP